MKRLTVVVVLAASLFGFNSVSGINSDNSSTSNSYYAAPLLKGKVVKAYVRSGYGPRGYDWLFMDVKTSSGILHVGIAPVFVLSNLPIKEGDEVEIRGFTPPMWPEGSFKALDIYDITQKKDYTIAGYARGRGPGWRWR
ncbi:hypothetical protein [Caminibacter pacificus]